MLFCIAQRFLTLVQVRSFKILSKVCNFNMIDEIVYILFTELDFWSDSRFYVASRPTQQTDFITLFLFLGHGIIGTECEFKIVS